MPLLCITSFQVEVIFDFHHLTVGDVFQVQLLGENRGKNEDYSQHVVHELCLMIFPEISLRQRQAFNVGC